MAANVIDWVWEHSKAANASLIVLLAIAHEANGDGQAEMGTAELAAKCHLGERTVQTAVRELCSAGDLQAARSVGRGHRTHYQVPVNPAGSAPFKGVNPADPAGIPPSNPADSAPFEETPQILHPLAEDGNPADSAPFKGSDCRSEDVPELKGAESAGLGFSNKVFTTGTSTAEVKPTSAIDDPPPQTAVDRLCDHLADRIEANGAKRPAIGKKWRDAARLMLDRDGYTEQQIHAAIDWCQDNEFWRSNILSMPKLREKYETLRLRASQKPRSRQVQTGDLFDRAMTRARAREEASDPHRDRDADQVRPSLLPAPGDR